MDKVINSLTDAIVKYFKNNGFINESKKDVYQYGTLIALQSFINTIITLFIGIVFGMFYENICFFIIFKMLRKFSGGFHSSNYSNCLTISIICNVMFMILIKILNFCSFYSVALCFEIFSLIVLMKFAPIENPNKPISSHEQRIYKGLSVLICIFLIAISIPLFINNNPFIYVIGIATTFNSFLIVIQRIVSKKTKNIGKYNLNMLKNLYINIIKGEIL